MHISEALAAEFNKICKVSKIDYILKDLFKLNVNLLTLDEEVL